MGAEIAITRDKDGLVTGTQASQGESHWEVTLKHNLLGQEIERALPGGVVSRWERDAIGRPRKHWISTGEKTTSSREYLWAVNDRLKGIYDKLTGAVTRFSYDAFSNLVSANYSIDNSWDYKFPDAIGNLFKTEEQNDRTYGKAGQLLKDENYTYRYDALGNLIKKEGLTEEWEYHWSQTGMLRAVLRSDKRWVQFAYDALGRRISKTFGNQTTHYIWDGNVLLHEWTAHKDESHTQLNEAGELEVKIPENLVTWVFEEGSFVPQAKLVNGKAYSIITDHLGTPMQAFDEQGKKVWACALDIYGKVRKFTGDKTFIPFRYQGQMEDEEVDVYYNRFRYYSPDSGTYISQDPIGLEGGGNLYAYVHDPNNWVDPFGLDTIRLRHYTSNKGLKGIQQDMVIKAGDQNAVFAVKAKGKALSMADAEAKFKINPGHGRNYVEFDIDDSKVEFRKNDLGVKEYKIKGDVDLKDANAKFVKRCG